MCKVALVNFNTSQTQNLTRATSFARAKLYVSARKFQYFTNTEFNSRYEFCKSKTLCQCS